VPQSDLSGTATDVLADIDELQVRSDRRLVSAVLVFILVPLFWSLGLELAEYGNDHPRIEARLAMRGLAVLVPGLGLLLVRAAHSRAAYSRAVLAIVLTMELNLVNNLLRPQGSILPMRAALMFLIIMYVALPNSFARQVWPALFYTAGVIVERAFWLTSDAAGDFATDVLILLFVNAIGVVMVHRRVSLEREIVLRLRAEQTARFTAHQALADLRTLRGIVPICSHCRKVRTEIGDWQQLEQYVAEHTEADFSHGVCPTCMREHYRSKNPATPS
jgi:membrane-associated HD superfamily phosphohydrolase